MVITLEPSKLTKIRETVYDTHEPLVKGAHVYAQSRKDGKLELPPCSVTFLVTE